MLSANYLSPDEIEAVAAEFKGQRIAIPEPGAFLLGMVHNEGFATVQGHVYDLHKPSGTLVRRDVVAFIERYRAFTVSQSTNIQNQRKACSVSGTGILGVSFDRRTGKYAASIKTPDGKSHWLGHHATGELAGQAYLEAKRRLHEGCTL